MPLEISCQASGEGVLWHRRTQMTRQAGKGTDTVGWTLALRERGR